MAVLKYIIRLLLKFTLSHAILIVKAVIASSHAAWQISSIPFHEIPQHTIYQLHNFLQEYKLHCSKHQKHSKYAIMIHTFDSEVNMIW